MTTADLLVVGAGHGQVPAIRVAQAMGLKVLAVDRDLTAPGMAIADFRAAIDVIDIRGVVECAREHRVRAALTLQSDLPVPAVGAVNDTLGLVGVTSSVAQVTSNKIDMRRRLASAGLQQPKFGTASSVAEAIRVCHEIRFPCIIKAPDSSGSRGVTRVTRPQEVSPAFADALKFSRGKTVIVEEFITGVEFGAQTFSMNGRCIAVHLHDDELSNPPFFVPIFHAYPSSLSPDVADRAKADIAQAVEALGVSDGPANVDAIINDEGVVQIIEVGARVGATCLPELTTIHTGIDWIQATIEAALGEPVDLQSHAGRPAAAYILESPADGILVDWTVDRRIIEDPRVIQWEVTAPRTSRVSRLRKGTDRIGKVVVSGFSREDAVLFARIARDSVVFHVNVEDRRPDVSDESLVR